MQNNIRVMVIDNHAVVRSGLAIFLMTCDNMELVGEAESGAQALERCPLIKPDVVLMDLVMPDMDGTTVIRQLREHCPDVQVIVSTSSKEQELAQSALQAGAIGCLQRDVTAAELASAIRAAAMGKPILAPEAAQALIQPARHPAENSGFDLTMRECEVLELMVEGLNNDQIAKRLGISPSTAKFHVSNVLSKLDAANRTEAAVIALQHKLVK
ncbi:response regulator transcription factor [uncultured Chloroflexus sp.]|uniref:response regulator n=1 Tax=uncultured Chloroflexus sp. TaxID=214040 RepID=UPI002608C1E9|nr:response regulator transcription factor [uncultured Chloroflexus sp.]